MDSCRAQRNDPSVIPAVPAKDGAQPHVVVVTGAASGIGLAASALFAAGGDNVMAVTGTTLVVDGGLLANTPGQAIPAAWTVPITQRRSPAEIEERE